MAQFQENTYTWCVSESLVGEWGYHMGHRGEENSEGTWWLHEILGNDYLHSKKRPPLMLTYNLQGSARIIKDMRRQLKRFDLWDSMSDKVWDMMAV